MQNRAIIYPEQVQLDHAQVARGYLVKAKKLRVEKQAPKVKALRRKLSALRPKPVPDAGVVYERVNPNGSIRKYKVMPNGEWRRVND